MTEPAAAGGIQFWIDLANHIKSKVDSYETTINSIDRSLKRFHQMNIRPLTQAFTLNSSGFGIADLGQPGFGYEWIVRLISISDAALWSNSMGSATCQWGVGKAEFIPNLPMSTPSVRWPFVTLPNCADFGTNHFTVGSSDALYCQIQGGNSGEQCQATAVVEEWPVGIREVRTG